MDTDNFVVKPPRGWLHSDQLVAKEGITYSVRYIGCLQINTSMKSLDFDTRSQVAKECINRVCEAAGLKSVDRKRKMDKRVLKAIEDKPKLDHAGTNVNLTVSSACLTLTALDTGSQLVRHEMPRISFACGGDTDTLDFVAYVAKNLDEWRACYVVECGGGLAQEVITTVGQAFELRYKQFLQYPPTPGPTDATPLDSREYYNDLPGKVPPDVGPPPVPPLPAAHHTAIAIRSEPEVKNLIDLRSEPDPAPPDFPEHHYVNQCAAPGATSLLNEASNSAATAQGHARLPPQEVRRLLQNEIWFHGCVSRQEAESLLKEDGEFLVRESLGSPGQYVLTGMQGGVKKHLLLIDPEGAVRTKDRIFENVSHLVNYHLVNQVPIISAESALVLRYPIPTSR